MDLPLAAVRRWAFAWDTTIAHRVEPLLHERLWLYRGRAMSESEAVRTAHGRRVGYDDRGRVVIAGPARHPVEVWGAYSRAAAVQDGYADTGVEQWPGGPTDLDVVRYRDSAVEIVTFHGERTITTEFDATGAPVRTTHRGDENDEELYEYAGGELVGIKQPGHVVDTDLAGALMDIFDGWLRVERDAYGPLALVGEHGWGVVWSRCEEPWSELLARGADAIAAQAVAAVASARLPAAARTFGLALSYIGQGSLNPSVCVLTDGAQRSALWGPYGDDGPVLELDGWDSELDRLLMQEAGLNQPGNPFRAVLDAVASRLARHDWSGVLELADDFVVISSEHDELTWPKYQSLLACNPPERIAAWRTAWPQGARIAEADLQYPWISDC